MSEYIRPRAFRGILVLTILLASGCSSLTGTTACQDGVCKTERPTPPQGP